MLEDASKPNIFDRENTIFGKIAINVIKISNNIQKLPYFIDNFLSFTVLIIRIN